MNLLSVLRVINSLHNLSIYSRIKLNIKAIASLATPPLQPQIIAVISVRNEEKYLPGFFNHLRDYVDGFVVLDDGSTDKTYNILSKEPKIKYFIQNKNTINKAWDEVSNKQKLLKAASQFGNVVLCCDADERFSKHFRNNLRYFSYIALLERHTAFGLHFRELWNDASQFRCDGIWGKKKKYILFSLSDNMTFDRTMFQKYHIPWYHDMINNLTLIDDDLFHLKMIKKEDRYKRFKLYEKLDPNHKMQTIGYSYLIDESELKLCKLSSDEMKYLIL